MSRIKRWIEAQRGQGLAWLVLLFAAGIATYYALPFEPDRGAIGASVAAFFLLALLLKAGRRRWLLLLVPALGLGWASLYSLWHHPSMLRTELTPRPLAGTVEDIERVEKGVRITLDDVEIRGLDAATTPSRVRLSVRLSPAQNLALPPIGAKVSLLAGLLPPMGAATPGGFDFARYFYFRDIGAVGYGLPPWRVVSDPPHKGMAARFQQWRLTLTESIIATLGPQTGPIAAGLITGEDRAIREGDFEALKAANLYHIIAISGGHMVVIAGVVFVALRLLMLLLPGGQHPRVKSIAAAITLAIVTLYLAVTGMPISAVRAYVMIALVLIAVMLRRDADPMRSLMLTALIMLLIDPSDLLEPGFQLSFVATLAIVALAEATLLRRPHDERGWGYRLGVIIVGSIAISLVAEAATSFLVARMFNQFAPYGVLANALATPLVTFVLMPAVALFFVLLPFGLQDYALEILRVGIEAMMDIAYGIADLPQAQIFLPSPPGWGLLLFMAGLLMLTLVRGKWRWLGLAPCAWAWMSITTIALPDVLIGSQAKQIALRTPHGYALVRGRADSLVPELWANALGYPALPVLRANAREAWRCDRLGCIARFGDHAIAFPTDPVALLEDCTRNAWVVLPVITRGCDTRIITARSLAQRGVHALWLNEQRLETSTDWQGMRPWSLGWRERR